MSYLPIALAAYFLNGAGALIDKFLLTEDIKHPIVYVFYISVLSLVALLFLPFTTIPTLTVLGLASLSTFSFVVAEYCLYCALRIGQTSRVIPIIGTLVPLFLLVEGIYSQTLTSGQVTAVAILILGIIFLTITGWRGAVIKKELVYEILAGIFFAAAYLLIRQAYLRETFFTVLIWSQVVLLPLCIILIVFPRTNRLILDKSSHQPKFHFLSKEGFLFFMARAAGGGGQILLSYAVSLTSPALVNALQSTQYGFLFIAALLLHKRFPVVFKERFTLASILTKAIGIICIGIGLYVLTYS
jgi:drug/metabolite transporter (DMT)-like permease